MNNGVKILRIQMTKIQGFTLIEMIIVIVILSIIAAMSVPLLSQGLNNFSVSEDIVNATWQGQIAMSRMSRDIRLIRSVSDLSTTTSTSIGFTDINNNTISYSLSGNNLVLTYNGSPANLATGIQNLAFTYYDKNGSSTATASLVRFVNISINVIQGHSNLTLTTMINPRNLS